MKKSRNNKTVLRICAKYQGEKHDDSQPDKRKNE